MDSNSLRFTTCCILSSVLIVLVCAQPKMSEECTEASLKCEEDTDCVHRLAVLQSTCITSTCQPQCRNAVLNLYQNRLGRALLRTDASCIPGRYEMKMCNLLPERSPLHCNLAKLICEADMTCNAKWEVFTSECESDAVHDQCSDQCKQRLKDTFATEKGAALAHCTCTKQEDQLCENLKNTTLKACSEEISAEITTITGDHYVSTEPSQQTVIETSSTASATLLTPSKFITVMISVSITSILLLIK